MGFEDLTWEDLEDWAGAKVLGRGKSYRREVSDLRIASDGRLLAWVQGGSRYATLVSLGALGKLDSICTCPYRVSCKHAVATVLTYLDTAQAGGTVPAAAADDRRLRLLSSDDDEDDEVEEVDEDGDESGDEDDPSSAATVKSAGKRRSGGKAANAVAGHLESLSHTDLLAFAKELAAADPDVRERVLDRARLKSGSVAKLVASIRREIEVVASEPAWADRWSGESAIPDYSRIKERLEALLASGHADDVVELGGTLLECGSRQIELSHDEGEIGQEVAECMEIAFRALRSSGRPGPERLLWEVDARLKDDYGIFDSINGLWKNSTAFNKADWSTVADALTRRMEAIRVTAKADGTGCSTVYQRKSIMDWLLNALEHAGRADEATVLLIREAGITNCYIELVNHLLAKKQRDAAEEWARKGFGQTIGNLSGIAWRLEERLREIARRKKNGPLVAAFRAMEFFDLPDEGRYAEVRKAVEPLGYWESIREMLLQWLETGDRPDGVTAASGSPRGGHTNAAQVSVWPLPPTGINLPHAKDRFPFPLTRSLIAIAIKEKRNDDILRWYHHGKQQGGLGMDDQGDAVATAVQKTHPDQALAIWKSLAVAHIAMTKPSAYKTAGTYLRKMRTVYEEIGRRNEWDGLLAQLRTEHARKPRMVEMLDGLEGKRSRILDR
ncbi:MAG: hypothetical protein ABIF71_14115 [Planctomycetota bacterium]